MPNPATLREYLILFVCGLPFMLILGKLLFGSWHGFWEALRFTLTPDLLSIFRGEWLEDQWASLKLIIFLLLCAAALVLAHGQFFAPRL